MTLTTPIDPTTIERAAETAYHAGMALRSDQNMRAHPWDTLPEYFKRVYRAQVVAVIGMLEGHA